MNKAHDWSARRTRSSTLRCRYNIRKQTRSSESIECWKQWKKQNTAYHSTLKISPSFLNLDWDPLPQGTLHEELEPLSSGLPSPGNVDSWSKKVKKPWEISWRGTWMQSIVSRRKRLILDYGCVSIKSATDCFGEIVRSLRWTKRSPLHWLINTKVYSPYRGQSRTRSTSLQMKKAKRPAMRTPRKSSHIQRPLPLSSAFQSFYLYNLRWW